MAAGDVVNPTQFGMKPFDPEIGEAMDKVPSEGRGYLPDLPRKRVRVADLHSNQREVHPDRVQQYVEHPSGSMDGMWKQKDPPHVVRTASGKLGVRDGHHRVSAALVRGQKTMTVRVQDI